MTKEQAVKLIKTKPYKLARAIGFTKLTEMHNDWMKKMLFSKNDKTLQGSRGTYKTTCVSFVLAVIIVFLPNKRTMFMRKTDNDVKEVIRQVQNILKTEQMNALSLILHGKRIILTVESATEISTNLTNDIKGTSQLVGLGLGSSLTGKHFDYIFTDDIVNIKDRISRAERDRTKMLYQELANIKNRDGRIFNTGTPWHKDDCFAIMPDAEKFDCYNEQVREIITDEELKALKESMLPSLFSANYELRHIASEDIIFDNPQTDGDICNIEQAKYCHIDAAYGGEDYTAFTVCKKYNGKYYVLGKIWQKHVDNCEDEIISIRKQYNIGRILCENNGDKGYLAKELKKKGERVVSYHEDMNKFLKITSYLKNVWKDVIFVDGTDKDYIDMICDYNENAEHDDAPDSLASIIRKLWGRKDQTDKQEERERYNVYLQ